MKFLIFLFLAFNFCLFPQDTNFVKRDSTVSIPDTLLTDTTAVDTFALLDSTKLVVYDTITPLYTGSFYNHSFFVSRKQILRSNYRYSGDILLNFPFSYSMEHGLTGYPNEFSIYGAGPNTASIFNEGVFFNNRLDNFLDLNHIKSESIDSIELVPSVRGFLYGTKNNFSSVNVINRDFVSPTPYTRLKYYEGQFEEGMIDGIFNSILFDKTSAYAEMYNRKSGLRYLNTDYSLWSGKFKVKHFFSNFFNASLNYDYSRSNAELNGGVDVDSIFLAGEDPNVIIYDEIQAPVVYNTRVQDVTKHLFNLKLLYNPAKYSFSELNMYYLFNRDELWMNENNFQYKSSAKIKTTGASLGENIKLFIFDLQLRAVYEYSIVKLANTIREVPEIQKFNLHNYSGSAVFSFYILDSLFYPSVFYKYSGEAVNDLSKTISYNGFGFDLNFNLLSFLNLYGGYSLYKNQFADGTVKNFETGIEYNDYVNKARVYFFSRHGYKEAATYPLYTLSESPVESRISGTGTSLNILFWKILAEGSAAYYFDKGRSIFSSVPRFSIAGGLYYKDILFDGNLDLKAGFNISLLGKRIGYINTFENQFNRSVEIPNSYRLDFSVSGIISKDAIAYFQWENLTGNQYYLIPYYPMLPRGIVFGLAWELLN